MDNQINQQSNEKLYTQHHNENDGKFVGEENENLNGEQEIENESEAGAEEDLGKYHSGL